MPWSNQGGGPWGSGGGKGPWGSGQQPSGGGSGPPDLEELLRRSQDKLRTVLPGGNLGGKGVLLLILAALLVWGLLPGWIVTSYLPGILLAGAALYRAAYLLFFVRYRGGGGALPLLVSLTAGELALGSWMFLREDPTLSGLAILGSLLALLTPTAVALFRRE